MQNQTTEHYFDIPVVVFMFRRYEKTVQIIKRIASVKPKKLYLISDYGRYAEEISQVMLTRKNVEKAIDWECEVIKNYATENKGIYDRIALGAKWVLEQEKSAIFLEDDNLPEVTFFRFCKEMLERYQNDTRVLWICGTNFIKKYAPEDGSDYVFTQHSLPCGWASWGHKFLKYYDFNFSLFGDDYLRRRTQYVYGYDTLYNYDMQRVGEEAARAGRGERYVSWDYQMLWSLRVHNLYGIAPKYNQITNIGVDAFSEHGGVSFDNEMTRRVCGVETFPLEFPLKHPKAVLTDLGFEAKTAAILLPY